MPISKDAMQLSCRAVKVRPSCSFCRKKGYTTQFANSLQRAIAVFGTCAGAILLATHVKNPDQSSLGLLDMTVLRNGYGRQLASDVFFGRTELKKDPLEMVFIRGPIIESVAPGVQILAEYNGKPTLVQKDNLLAATFHPELTDDPTVHRHFLQMASTQAAKSAEAR